MYLDQFNFEELPDECLHFKTGMKEWLEKFSFSSPFFNSELSQIKKH